jgi:hypothetical protein
LRQEQHRQRTVAENGVNIAGATQPGHHTGDNHVRAIDLAVVVSNTVGTVTSAAATLTVSAAPVGPRHNLTHESDRRGIAATFTVVAAEQHH